MTYKEKLRNPLWKEKRLEILERDNHTCVHCLDSTSKLQIHHIFYIEGLEPWEYDNKYLKSLCALCHEIETLIVRQKKKLKTNLFNIGCELPDSCPACGSTDIQIRLKYFHCTLCGYDMMFEEMREAMLNNTS